MTDSPNITPQPLAATLSDLECSTITVVITLADSAEVTVPMKLIPQFRMMQLSAMIPDAPPPPPGKDIRKNPDGSMNWDFNYNDPAYVAADAEVNWKRNCLMLAEMLQLPLTGETLQEKADYIRTAFDPLVTDQLISVVRIQRQKVKARIITRAETFLAGRN